MLDCDRSTAIQAVKRLEAFHHIVKVQGIGRQSNRYLAVERLATGAPSMAWPVAER
jgi:DNA-binding GntR family transcriptional regulator